MRGPFRASPAQTRVETRVRQPRRPRTLVGPLSVALCLGTSGPGLLARADCRTYPTRVTQRHAETSLSRDRLCGAECAATWSPAPGAQGGRASCAWYRSTWPHPPQDATCQPSRGGRDPHHAWPLGRQPYQGDTEWLGRRQPPGADVAHGPPGTARWDGCEECLLRHYEEAPARPCPAALPANLMIEVKSRLSTSA